MIMDRSGSMERIERQVISSFNSFVEEQKNVDAEGKLSYVQFDTEYECVYQGVDLQDVEPLTSDTFVPRGMTALLDAIGRTISKTKKRLRDSDAKVIMVITTDGLENASTEYRQSQVKRMIQDCEDNLGWKFIYLAADDASFDCHDSMGMKSERSFKTGRGVEAFDHASVLMSKKIAMYRMSQQEEDLHFSKEERDEADHLDEK